MDADEGIQRQLARCRAEVSKHGWTVVESYQDNETSASKVRGAKSDWARMLADIKAGNVDTVVAVDMDRLLRSMRDLVTLTDLGVKVVTVSGEIDTASADGAFRAHMLAAIAEFEVKRKAERQVRANEYRVSNLGLPVPGKRRYGFEQGNIKERPAEAREVRHLYREVLSGASVFGLS
ncbi:recombinase family protein, partial [uncultured Microbacterium sp.]|uniref:recombinase family protein n=1 Tax=uncultured Microbacterium sp. TaxID=191216 RepID=UPI0025E1ABDF